MGVRGAVALIGAAGLALSGVGCGGEEPVQIRGAGLERVELPVRARAGVYNAALGAAFELDDRNLYLMLDTLLLPRVAGERDGGVIEPALVQALRSRGSVRGVCVPERIEGRARPHCEARSPGYLVRFSEILRMPGDTVQVYLLSERYDTGTSRGGDGLRFETLYQIVNERGSWRAVREARVPRIDD